MLAEDGADLDGRRRRRCRHAAAGEPGRRSEGRSIAFHPRHAIRLAAGARLTVIEIALGRGRYLHNPVTEIEVAPGATLTHIRLQDESPDAFHLATIYADVQQAGFYDAFTLTLGGRTRRAEFHARLRGPGATVHLNAAQLLGGDQVGDVTTVVMHDAPHCASRARRSRTC